MLPAQNVQREFQVTWGEAKTQRIRMFVVASLQKRLVSILQIMLVSKKALFERGKIYQHAIVIHSMVVSLSDPSSTPCVSVWFLSTPLLHIFQLQNYVCGERRML